MEKPTQPNTNPGKIGPIPLERARIAWEIPSRAGCNVHIHMQTKQEHRSRVTLTLTGPKGGIHAISVINIDDLLVTTIEILEAQRLLAKERPKDTIGT